MLKRNNTIITGRVLRCDSKLKKGRNAKSLLQITLENWKITNPALKEKYRAWKGDRVEIYFAPKLHEKLRAAFKKEK